MEAFDRISNNPDKLYRYKSIIVLKTLHKNPD